MERSCLWIGRLVNIIKSVPNIDLKIHVVSFKIPIVILKMKFEN